MELPPWPQEIFYVAYHQRTEEQVGTHERVFTDRAEFDNFLRYADATRWVPGSVTTTILRIGRFYIPVWEQMRWNVIDVLDLGIHEVAEMPEQTVNRIPPVDPGTGAPVMNVADMIPPVEGDEGQADTTDRMAPGSDQPPPHPGGEAS